jgi:very-short-patch-repair endonuclease
VLLPSDPEWKRGYAATVQRLVRDGVETPLANLFVAAVQPSPPEATGVERARSASEAFLYRRLETLSATRGRFQLNVRLPIAFDGQSQMEVDFLNESLRIVIELDGSQHLADAEAYRRDRRKDRLLQQNGYLVMRFLAGDAGKDLDGVLDSILQSMAGRERSRSHIMR